MGSLAYAEELDAYLAEAHASPPHVAYQRDPIAWAEDVLGIAPETLRWSLNPGYHGWAWDGTPDPLAVAFEAIADGKDAAIESGTGTGKSFGAAVLILWFLACFEDAEVYTFAPTEDQLKLYIWKNIGELWPKFQIHFPKAVLTSLTIRMRGGIEEKWSAHGRPVAIRTGENVSTRAAGMHAEHMLLVYEETPGIDKSVMVAGKNTCTAPHNLRLAIGNPNHRLDTLHQMTRESGVVAVRMSALDHPNVVTGNHNLIPGAVSQASISKRLADYGDTSPVYQSRVRGVSPEQPANALIRHEWLEASARRYAERMAKGLIPTRITGKGVDVANSEHGDRAAICDFAETVVVRLEAFPCADANQLGRQVVGEAKSQGLAGHRVAVDPIGVGAGTVNEARRLRFDVQALNFGASPVIQAERAPDGSVHEWTPDANRFRNRRGQTYWQLREDLQHAQIDMPEDEELWEELLALTFEEEGKVVKLVPKEDIVSLLGRSPDKSDALALANWVRERKVVAVVPAVKDVKLPHRANPIQVKDGKLVAVKRQPQSVGELLDQIEANRPGRLVHRERLPRRRYN